MLHSRRPSLILRTCAATAALLLATACSGDGGGEEPNTDVPDSSEETSEERTTEPTSEPTSAPTSAQTEEEPTEQEPTEEEPTVTDGLRVTGDSYSYAVPEGWEDIIDTPDAEGADTIVRSTTPVGVFATNVNTVISAGSGLGTLTADTPRLRQVRKQFARSTKAQIGALPRPIENTELDGSFAIGQTVDEYPGRGTTLTLTQYGTVRDDVSYVITLTAATADAENADAALMTVMDSWTWE
jgi:hypothetical protein